MSNNNNNNKQQYQHQNIGTSKWLSNLISYNDVLLVIVILLNMAFCVIVGPKDGYTTTNTILIINANAIMAIIINICLMLLDVVFCVIVCPEDGGATHPNKWWQPEPKGIYRMGAAMDKIWTNKQISFLSQIWWNLIV